MFNCQNQFTNQNTNQINNQNITPQQNINQNITPQQINNQDKLPKINESFIKNLKLRSYNSAINDLCQYTKILKNTDISELPTSGKVLLLICNPYFNTSYKLGNPVCNDCKIISEKYLSHDYLSYCLFDGTVEDFRKYLKFFLSHNYDDLIIYYSGHGVQVVQESFKFDYSLSKYVLLTESEIESDGMDECLLFNPNSKSNTSQLIYDDEITSLLKTNKCKNILMICDCCHAETILDSLTNNICLISSCKDSESSIQLVDNGIFTYYLVKYFDLPLDKLIDNVKMKISRYGQNPSLKMNNRNYLFI